MPARTLRPRHQDEIRTKIQASQLVNRLTNHALGKLDKPMDATQVQAARILLGKTLPDLSQIQGPGENGEHQHTFEGELRIVDPRA